MSTNSLDRSSGECSRRSVLSGWLGRTPWRNRRRQKKRRAAGNLWRAVEPLESRVLLSVSILNGGGSGYPGISDGTDPPDATGAAGPNCYLESTNGTLTLYGKANGTTLASENPYNFFFSPSIGGLTQIDSGSCGGCDATMVYDDLMGGNGRFVIGNIDVDPVTNVSQFVFAVSKSNNPTTLTSSDWNFYHITTTKGSAGTWTDYPGNPGFNADAVVVSFNMARGTNLTGNAEILSIDAADLASGVSQASLHSYINYINGSFDFRPTAMHDSVAGDPMWLVRDNRDGTHINVYRMSNVLSNSATIASPTTLAIPAADTFNTGHAFPENPDGTMVNSIGYRIQKAAEYNNTIVAAQQVKVASNQLDVQWYAIDVGGATPAFQKVGGVDNVGRIGFGANSWASFPGIDINSSGEIGLSFIESDKNGGPASATTGGFMSMFVTARKPTDAAGTMQPAVLVPAGTGFGNIEDRIGDFSGINVDPVNGTFWAVNEFGNYGNGATAIANFTPDAPPVVTAPSDQTGVEGTTKSFNLGSFSDADGSPWTVNVDWGDGTNTTFSVAADGSLGTRTHTYAKESAADHVGSDPYVVTVTVTDLTSFSDSATFNVTVSDPAVAGTGGFTFTAVEGTPSAVQTVATFTDPGGAEVLSDYSALIDWGDGTPATVGTISGPDGSGVFTVTGSHTYATGAGQPDEFGNTFCGANPPSYNKTITVSISHELAPLAVTASTAAISLTPASAHLAGGNLIVVGTTSDDQILINPVGNTGQVDVNLNSVDLGSFALGAGGRIIVASIAGNDNIQVASGVQANTVLYGGPGNDRIKGGGGQNILVGCEGDDLLIGGNQGDLLIGGQGTDTLNGGAGNDILVAGTVINPITLLEDDKYSDLVNILNGGSYTAVGD